MFLSPRRPDHFIQCALLMRKYEGVPQTIKWLRPCFILGSQVFPFRLFLISADAISYFALLSHDNIGDAPCSPTGHSNRRPRQALVGIPGARLTKRPRSWRRARYYHQRGRG